MTETNASKASSPNSKPAKAFSCVRCFERKVKCDKENPCGGCVRSNVECIFRVPAPPRRKKKRTQEDILTERLNQYEQILQQKGINIENVPTRVKPAKAEAEAAPAPVEPTPQSEPASAVPTASAPSNTDSKPFVSEKFIWAEGRSRYTDNHLWTRVTEEFQQSQDAIHESSDEEDEETEQHEPEDNVDFLMGLTPSSTTTRNLHPPLEHVSVLWQVYLDNINPFSMIVHRPTMEQSILKAAQHLDHVPRGLEALMFAIYSAAVFSMQERDVDYNFGESKSTLMRRYRAGTKAALSRARFMGSSDIVVLQAFVIHLFSMRDVYDGRTLWTFSGIALRIAEGMGLHRDGTLLGLPPFKTEMRRRLWFQIVTLEYRSAELSGSNKFRPFERGPSATKPPLNINDSDLWPSMTEFPPEREEITDMVLCSIRYTFGTWWHARTLKRTDSVWENWDPNSMQEKDKAIDGLEQFLDEKFLKHCDPTVPIQLMASILARAGPNMMRFMAHHPRRYASDAEVPEGDKKLLWEMSNRMLDNYAVCVSSKSLQKFDWHTEFYFQWQSLIYLLDVVRADPLMPGTEDAWKRIDTTFECHPTFVNNTKKAIHVAVGSLCLKAYNAKVIAFKEAGRFLPAKPPEYIVRLRKQRDTALAKQIERKAKAEAESLSLSPGDTPNTTITNDLVSMMGFEPAASTSIAPRLQQLQLQQQQQQQQQFEQQPLPMFQPLPAPPLKQSQLPMPYWFDSSNSVAIAAGVDTDWMLMQDPINEQGNQMDWTQWDYLLQDSGGSVGFADSRTLM